MHEKEGSPSQLRQFAWVTGAMFVLVFGILPWAWNGSVHVWPLVVAGMLWLWGLAAPAGLRPVYDLWMRFAGVLGSVNNRVLLCILYFGMLLPVGLVLRGFRRDPLRRRFEPYADSYRIDKSVRDRDHLERPF